MMLALLLYSAILQKRILRLGIWLRLRFTYRIFTTAWEHLLVCFWI